MYLWSPNINFAEYGKFQRCLFNWIKTQYFHIYFSCTRGFNYTAHIKFLSGTINSGLRIWNVHITWLTIKDCCKMPHWASESSNSLAFYRADDGSSYGVSRLAFFSSLLRAAHAQYRSGSLLVRKLWQAKTFMSQSTSDHFQLSWKQELSWVTLEDVGGTPTMFAARLRTRKIRLNITLNFSLWCYLITANK